MQTRALIPLALLLLTGTGCNGQDGAAASTGAGNGRGGRGAGGAAVPVAVGSVVQKAMPLEIAVIGAAEPLTSVAIRAQTTGQLTSVNFTEGDDVKAGQTLFTLDRRPLEAALQQAQANLDRDLAQAVNAAQQAKRYDELAQRGIATREQVDTSRTAVAAL
jgi:multidrug efflux system membrane fusion protein